jgi:hypothetical protein
VREHGHEWLESEKRAKNENAPLTLRNYLHNNKEEANINLLSCANVQCLPGCFKMQFADAHVRRKQPCSRTSIIAGAKMIPQSKIGKMPVQLPKGVDIKLQEGSLTVKVRVRPLPPKSCEVCGFEGSKISQSKWQASEIHAHLHVLPALMSCLSMCSMIVVHERLECFLGLL